MPLYKAASAKRIPVRQPLWEAPCIDRQQRIAQRFFDHYTREITTPAQRALISQWVLFANSTLPTELFNPFSREPELTQLMNVLNHQLDPEAQAHLSDRSFFPVIELSPYPLVQAVIEHTSRRPLDKLFMALSKEVINLLSYGDWGFSRCMGG